MKTQRVMFAYRHRCIIALNHVESLCHAVSTYLRLSFFHCMATIVLGFDCCQTPWPFAWRSTWTTRAGACSRGAKSRWSLLNPFESMPKSPAQIRRSFLSHLISASQAPQCVRDVRKNHSFLVHRCTCLQTVLSEPLLQGKPKFQRPNGQQDSTGSAGSCSSILQLSFTHLHFLSGRHIAWGQGRHLKTRMPSRTTFEVFTHSMCVVWFPSFFPWPVCTTIALRRWISPHPWRTTE